MLETRAATAPTRNPVPEPKTSPDAATMKVVG
jgi:hypothetical protein